MSQVNKRVQGKGPVKIQSKGIEIEIFDLKVTAKSGLDFFYFKILQAHQICCQLAKIDLSDTGQKNSEGARGF